VGRERTGWFEEDEMDTSWLTDERAEEIWRDLCDGMEDPPIEATSANDDTPQVTAGTDRVSRHFCFVSSGRYRFVILWPAN